MPGSEKAGVAQQRVTIAEESDTSEENMSAASSDAGSSETHDKFVEMSPKDVSEVSIVDPYCVAENPHRVSFQDVTSAAFLIKGGIEYTPCTVSVASCRCHGKIVLEIE